jgi:triphosphoribosyl-dephospho-CoA synthetase
MTSTERTGVPATHANPQMQAGWDAALQELQHQAAHLEARGAVRAAVTLYDAIRIARAGGLNCGEHPTA